MPVWLGVLVAEAVAVMLGVIVLVPEALGEPVSVTEVVAEAVGVIDVVAVADSDGVGVRRSSRRTSQQRAGSER